MPVPVPTRRCAADTVANANANAAACRNANSDAPTPMPTAADADAPADDHGCRIMTAWPSLRVLILRLHPSQTGQIVTLCLPCVLKVIWFIRL